VVVVLSGAGRKDAARATEALIDGHRPSRVISAGFAGGLSPTLKRNDILLANRVILAEGDGDLHLEPPPDIVSLSERTVVHVGALLSVDHVVRLPRQKQRLAEQYGALAVDMETFAVAEICQKRGVPFVAVRVINDTANEALSGDVEHLLLQKTQAARLGAAMGALWRRPGSAKEMYQLRENALVASQRLARFLASLIVH
jgi:adenosylhomocysteine nucleosidase